MNKSFEVIYRNPGHWDIYQNDSRIAIIRGEIGNVWLGADTKPFGEIDMRFPSVESCMAYVCATLMKE
jgi:hypothetical protein